MPPCNGPARAPFPGQPVLLYLRMVPVWVFVDEVRHFVESFCACARVGPEREGQLALATHELMQNAITNGTSADIELRLAIDAAADWVEVSLTNTCAPGQADRLRARVAKLQEAEPLTSYVAALNVSPLATSTTAGTTVTSSSTNWSNTSSDIVPNFGDYTDNYVTIGLGTDTDENNIYAAWADGRIGEPQPFFALAHTDGS